jgi:hypothetical protein
MPLSESCGRDLPYGPDSLDTKGAEFLVNLHPPGLSDSYARPFPSVHVSLNAESQDGQKITRVGHEHSFTTSERRDGGQMLWDDSTLEKVLDIVHPSSTPSPPQSKSGSFDLSVYEVRIDFDDDSRVLIMGCSSGCVTVSAPACHCYVTLIDQLWT